MTLKLVQEARQFDYVYTIIDPTDPRRKILKEIERPLTYNHNKLSDNKFKKYAISIFDNFKPFQPEFLIKTIKTKTI